MSQIASQPQGETASPSTGPGDQILPSIQLLCMKDEFSDAFKDAVKVHFPGLHQLSDITIHNCPLHRLPEEVQFDAVVSPANSYGRLDGAFDDALARTYQGGEDYFWLTRQAQKVLYEKWRGFAPPGTCTVVPLNSNDGSTRKHPWGTKYLMLCPTMRVPQEVTWDREVIYECIWSLLCAIDEHNRGVQNQSGEARINRILMTPLATGVGAVSAQRWAEQCVLALRHFVEARQNPRVWGSLEWEKIAKDAKEVASTYVADVS